MVRTDLFKNISSTTCSGASPVSPRLLRRFERLPERVVRHARDRRPEHGPRLGIGAWTPRPAATRSVTRYSAMKPSGLATTGARIRNCSSTEPHDSPFWAQPTCRYDRDASAGMEGDVLSGAPTWAQGRNAYYLGANPCCRSPQSPFMNWRPGTWAVAPPIKGPQPACASSHSTALTLPASLATKRGPVAGSSRASDRRTIAALATTLAYVAPDMRTISHASGSDAC